MVEHHPVMGNLSVLVLDDDPTSLQTISNMLVESGSGFKVNEFHNPDPPTPYRAKSRMVSSSTKRTKQMLILQTNNLSHPKSNDFEGPEVGKGHGCSKKPDRADWTIELHEKFLDAIKVLGDKFATPRGILKLMKVKGLTLKQIASHLQKHRLRQQNAKQRGQYLRNANTKPVSELIGSAENTATTESITPRDDTEVYPSRLWAQVKKKLFTEAAALKTCTYTCTSGLQKEFSPSNRNWQQLPAKSNVVVIDGCVSSEAQKAAGEIGYGAAVENSGSSNQSTSLVDQFGENNPTEAAGNMGNINLLQGFVVEGTMTKEQTAAKYLSDVQASLMSDDLDLIGPSDGREEEFSCWKSLLEGSQDQQNLGLEELLQVDNSWNTVVASPAQVPTVQNALVDNPVVPIAQDDEFWPWSPPVGDFDMML